MDRDSLMTSFVNHLEYSLAKDEYTATLHDCYSSLALCARDRLIERWIETQQAYYRQKAKRVYYLSLEYLMGRTLGNSLLNLGIEGPTAEAMKELGYDLEELQENEWDAGLGNGGLGRLAACFMDSMATLELPAGGYGLRYEYGIFFQTIRDGYQVESPDNWLRRGNIWEFPRPEYLYAVNFYGRVEDYHDEQGRERFRWVDAHEIMAMAYDTPIPGYGNNTVNNLRLWSAKSSREFDLEYFNNGDYVWAISDRALSENITRILYPNDNVIAGKELRLKQEYFFVSATLQDIIRRYKKTGDAFDEFADLVAIQLNDTHPALAVPELMRLLMDMEGLGWDEAWEITIKTFAYTNHTILPEALEKWPLELIELVLPRHIQIIYEINRRFLEEMKALHPGNTGILRDLSIIEEGDHKMVRMAHLAIIGSHSVNGVAALHSEILKEHVFRDFYRTWPAKFNNKTNGITQRRWLRLCNPGLSSLITDTIGEGWVTDLGELKKIIPHADDASFKDAWMSVKKKNKERLAEYILAHNGITVDPASLFDIQVKRLHEYKRQLLNVLHVVTLYNGIRDGSVKGAVPRTVVFAGKSAPGYYMAKLIIKLINSVAAVVNDDKQTNDLLKVVFLRNYAVSNAEKIIPAADLSEQISTAGTEASGTGNMKFALNGALTIGTLDGANIEIMEEVGRENIFIFGLDSEGVSSLRKSGYNPYLYYNSDPSLKRTLDMIRSGYFSPGEPDLFRPIVDSLLYHDTYMLCADYKAYLQCQARVSDAYTDTASWARMSVLNTASMGKFSSDRTIDQYAREIWGVKPVPISVPANHKKGG
ncbi:MAG TPA: glycogen/starch/alpha-glucan phosphorylase [Spirochaetota bacterium]|nr:glycogen/starch/alpha-glucan phosphorylase [Spirochaetota bacterium]HPI89713.1 glycogen/starch/alpha-glucan phosphorylase [Spirochaetota bacterium]HPR48328.1 glycogen/starch/alpha-glucan phosphorylase [Spirochaetota bacterium]